MKTMPRLTLPILIFLLFLFFVLLGQSYLRVKGRTGRLDLLRAEVQAFLGRKEELETELAYRQSNTYIEKEARELGYAKRGEVIVVLPDFEKEKEEEKTVATDSSVEASLGDKETPVWKRWGCLLIPSSWTCP